jgi:hypothetical protein
MQKLIASVLLFLMLTNQSVAQTDEPVAMTLTDSREIVVQDENFVIPNPENTVAASEKLPAIMEVFNEYFPKGKVFYNAYATEKNFDELISGRKASMDRYFVIIQTPEVMGRKHTTQELAEIADYLKKSDNFLAEKDVADRINAQIEKANKSLTKKTGEKVDLNLGNTGFLGTSLITERSAMFSIRAVLNDKTLGLKDTVVNSSVFMLLNDKIILIAAYSLEKKDEQPDSALEWTKNAVGQWTQAIFRANKIKEVK